MYVQCFLWVQATDVLEMCSLRAKGAEYSFSHLWLSSLASLAITGEPVRTQPRGSSPSRFCFIDQWDPACCLFNKARLKAPGASA